MGQGNRSAAPILDEQVLDGGKLRLHEMHWASIEEVACGRCQHVPDILSPTFLLDDVDLPR